MKIGVLIIAFLMVLSGTRACAQRVPPFFSAGAAAFEPQIGIVNAGVVQDAQAVVSHDLKYVTLNMQVQNTNLLALQEFTFQKLPSLGVVGLPQSSVAAARPGHPEKMNWAPLMTSPSEIKRQADSWVLEQEGMIRVADAP